MARLLKTEKKNIGRSPDVIYFQGEKKSEQVRLTLIDYDANEIQEHICEQVSDAQNSQFDQKTSWFNVDGLHDEETMREIAEVFKLEPSLISDALNTHARPKVHEYDDCVYLSIKMLQFDDDKGKIFAENLVLIITENGLLSFQEVEGDVFEPVRERLRKSKRRIRTSGSAYLAIALLDTVIDNYIYTISRIGEKIDRLDEALLTNPNAEKMEEIYKYKGEISYLRNVVKPCREMILNLLKLDSDLLPESALIHAKELQNNINLANDSVDSYREILSDQLSVFHTLVGTRLNDILKFLTIFSVIFIPLTFIAGIYGTNFDHVPELHYRYGYFIMWGVMILIAMLMIYYFKRKKWF